MNAFKKMYLKMKESVRFHNTKEVIDFCVRLIFLIATIISASFIVIIVVFVAKEGIRPFVTDNNGLGKVDLIKFLTGTTWLQGPTFRSNLYSVGFIIINTIYISFLSLLVSMPIGVLTALFIAKIAPKRLSTILRTVIELLAAIPSIIYGLFGSGVILSLIYNLAKLFGIQSQGGHSVLATVIVLSIMIYQQ